MRTENNAATHPYRRRLVTRPCSTCPLLAPRLRTAEIYVSLCLCRGCPATTSGTHSDNNIMHGLRALAIFDDRETTSLCSFECENCSLHCLYSPLLNSLLRRTDDNIASVSTRNRPSHQDQALLLTDLDNAKILDRYALITHVTRHPHILPNPTRG